MKPKILLISSDARIAKPFQAALEANGYSVRITGLTKNRKHDHLVEGFDLVITLWEAPARLKKNIRSEKVGAFFSLERQTREHSLKAYQNGVYQADAKDTGKFITTINELLKNGPLLRASPDTNQAMSASTQPHSIFERLIGQSSQIQKIRQLIKKISRCPGMPVLIKGETGTGKELVAELLHQASSRSVRPMVTVNCSAIPETLFESQLFGHRKGAFTGAIERQQGFIEKAQDRTLFLDEISTLPIELQPKLLRLLENGSFIPVGATDERRSNAWIIAAGNEDFDELIAQNEFRADLFYRLQGEEIVLPPLRERPEDIPLLVDQFCTQAARELDRPPKELAPAALELLQSYHWPGNVRQLKNIIYRLTNRCPHNLISPDDILKILPDAASQLQPKEKRIKTLKENELEYIREAFTMTGNKIGKTAELLGIDPKTLRRKLSLLGKRLGKK